MSTQQIAEFRFKATDQELISVLAALTTANILVSYIVKFGKTVHLVTYQNAPGATTYAQRNAIAFQATSNILQCKECAQYYYVLAFPIQGDIGNTTVKPWSVLNGKVQILEIGTDNLGNFIINTSDNNLATILLNSP